MRHQSCCISPHSHTGVQLTPHCTPPPPPPPPPGCKRTPQPPARANKRTRPGEGCCARFRNRNAVVNAAASKGSSQVNFHSFQKPGGGRGRSGGCEGLGYCWLSVIKSVQCVPAFDRRATVQKCDNECGRRCRWGHRAQQRAVQKQNLFRVHLRNRLPPSILVPFLIVGFTSGSLSTPAAAAAAAALLTATLAVVVARMVV